MKFSLECLQSDGGDSRNLASFDGNNSKHSDDTRSPFQKIGGLATQLQATIAFRAHYLID